MGNYVLYLHTITHDYERARPLYGWLMRMMAQRGPDVPFILLSYGLFLYVAQEEDSGLVEEMILRGKLKDPQLIKYKMAFLSFFRQAMVQNPLDAESNLNYAACIQWLYEHYDEATKYYLRVIAASPHKKGSMELFQEMLHRKHQVDKLRLRSTKPTVKKKPPLRPRDKEEGDDSEASTLASVATKWPLPASNIPDSQTDRQQQRDPPHHMADPRSNPGGGINGGDPPLPLFFQQDDSAAAAEAVAAAQLLTTAAAGVAGVAGYAVPGVIGGVPGELESMDLNMLREWLDESFSDNDADVSSSDGGGGSESLMQLLYQHQQQQLGLPGQGQQHFTGFGFGDESEMKMPAGMSMTMPPPARGGAGSKRQRAAEKRQRAGTNNSNSAAMATIDVTMSDDDDDEHGKKRTWPNQREELVYLRTKVCTLENELREIKIASRKQFNSSAAMLARFTSSDGKGMIACSTPGSLWEQVANRQLDEKVRAEVENRKLRGMVESQIRLAKKLQQLLRKRQIWEGLMEQKPKNEADMKPEESKIYAFLAQKIEDRFPHIDAFFDHHGLTHAMNEAREINVKFDDQAPSPGPGGAAGGAPASSGAPGPGGNMFIEMKECKIMPFDFRAADAAVWRCLKDEIITMHNTSATVIDTDENVLRAKVAVKLAGRDSEVELTVWSLWRRYMEHDRAVYAVESLAITSGTSVPGSPIIQIKQSATAIVRPFTLTSAPVASIVRVYVRSTPSIIQDAAQESAARAAGHPQVGVLTDMLIGSYHQNVEAMYKAVENLLLDELLKGKMRG